jgi:hypothetical protein
MIAAFDRYWPALAYDRAVGTRIERQTGESAWRIFATLDDVATELVAGADERLAWQSARLL